MVASIKEHAWMSKGMSTISTLHSNYNGNGAGIPVSHSVGSEDTPPPKYLSTLNPLCQTDLEKAYKHFQDVMYGIHIYSILLCLHAYQTYVILLGTISK
jgi:hypothetical protein